MDRQGQDILVNIDIQFITLGRFVFQKCSTVRARLTKCGASEFSQ